MLRRRNGTPIAECHGGVFRMGDETAFLDALEQGLHLTATATPTGTVLQPR